MKRHTVVSLFSGAGGLDLGFVRAGFEIVFANEYESFACETYRLNFGKLHNTDYLVEGDLNTVWDQIPKNPTLLIGGPPCQSFSMAGKRKGLGHENGQMFERTIQHLPEINPRFFILENVQGLLAFEDGPDNPLQILLKEIDLAGYECHYQLFDLSHYGVSQRRKRVIFFGKKKGESLNLLDFVPKISKEDPLTVDQVLRQIPKGLSGEEYSKPSHVQRIFGQIIAPGENLRTLEKLSTEQVASRLAKRGLDNDEKLLFVDGKVRFPKRNQDIQRLDPAKVAPTMSFNGGTTVHWHPWLDRQLTVREAATFQSFPYDFEFCGKNPVEKYLQIANAVPPAFSEKLAQQILTTLNKE